jgi:hypothetical protein
VLSHSLSHETQKISVDDGLARLQAGERGLTVALREWVAKRDAMVLVIDHLEEVFTLTTDAKTRSQFDALLATALSDQDGPLHLVTTIRSDFMMRFNSLPRLQALLPEKASRHFLPPVTEQGLRDVVCTPAKLAGLEWSDGQLPEDIVQAARGGGRPPAGKRAAASLAGNAEDEEPDVEPAGVQPTRRGGRRAGEEC